jgi:cobalt-zinc-cadmium efflux system outer membrane protein
MYKEMKLYTTNQPLEIRSRKSDKLKFQLSYFTFHIDGGSLAPAPQARQARAGLSTPSPRPTAQWPAQLRAFRSYPCRGTKAKPKHPTFETQNSKLPNVKFLLLTLALAVSASLHAQVLPLDSIIAIMERQNPMLQEYDNKAKALTIYAKGAKSWMAPMIGAGTFMLPYSKEEGMHESDKGAIMFSFEQSIPNPAKLNANKNYLESLAAIEEQRRSVQFNKLRSEAKTYYYAWLVAEKKIKLLKENERILELMLKTARIRYPYNQGSLGNIYTAEGRLNEIQNMILMTMGDIEESSWMLKTLMNASPDLKIEVDTTREIIFEPNQLFYDTVTLRDYRSDIRQINKTIETMLLNQRLQRFQAKPDVKLRFDHMQPVGDMPSQFTAMVMVSIPIAPWSSKMYRSEYKGMQFEIEGMKKNREALLLETRGMLAGMAGKLSRMKQQLGNYETKIIPALYKNYKVLMLAYEENREQLPMVLDGWEALNMAHMEYLDKLEEYSKMIVRYENEIEK